MEEISSPFIVGLIKEKKIAVLEGRYSSAYSLFGSRSGF